MNKSRYDRQIKLAEIGDLGQQKLNEAKVLVIGAGGLASAILPYIAAAGVGTIGIIDADVVAESNLQRQILYTHKSVGKSKVLQAKKSLQKLNPTIVIETVAEKFTFNNALSLCEEYDIIVDATDSIATRFLINDACCATQKPFVYGSIHKFEGQVAVFNYKGGATYRCVFNENTNHNPNCNETGVLGVVVGTIGMFQANEVLKMILGIGTVMSNKMMIYNSLTNEMNHFEIVKKSSNFTKDAFNNTYFKVNAHEISVAETVKKLKNNTAILVDVREVFEVPKITLEGCIQIPLNDLKNKVSALNKEKEIIIVCRSGVRSTKALKILQDNGFSKLKNLIKGAQKLHEHIIESELELTT
jgi:sulfur-carrier protein adenylyltransferase/sulfurtransferase